MKRTLPNLLTVQQAAAMLGITRQAVCGAITRGRMSVEYVVNHVMLLAPEAVSEYDKSRKKRKK